MILDAHCSSRVFDFGPGLEVAAVSWNLVCNLVAVYWLYEGIVKSLTTWFDISCDGCEVHDEDYRRGATG